MIFENFILHFTVVLAMETPVCLRYDYNANIAEKCLQFKYSNIKT